MVLRSGFSSPKILIVFPNLRLGNDERLAVGLVELDRDVACHLDVLFLVAADRHDVRVVNQNVRRHQHRVGEQPVIRREPLGQFILVAVATLEQPHRRERRQQPSQLAHLRHIALAEEHRLGRVEPAREKIQRNVECVFTPFAGVEHRRHRVIVRDKIIRLALLLQLDRRMHHAEVVANMQRPRRLDSR